MPEDDLNFIKSLIPIFQDQRYIRVEEKPFLIVYRPQHLPDAKKTLAVWREYCASIGLGELHICAALTHGNEDYVQYGFDSGVEFPPHNIKAENRNNQIKLYEAHKGGIYQYADIAQFYLDRNYINRKVFKTVFPSWDNTARIKNRALVVLNGHPENYEYWLSSTLDIANKNGDQLVFVNAWNEWAEGCHLEPDRKYGHGFLQATLNAKRGLRRFLTFPHISIDFANTGESRKFFKDIGMVFYFHAHAKFNAIKHEIHCHPFLYKSLFPFVSGVRRMSSRIRSILFNIN